MEPFIKKHQHSQSPPEANLANSPLLSINSSNPPSSTTLPPFPTTTILSQALITSNLGVAIDTVGFLSKARTASNTFLSFSPSKVLMPSGEVVGVVGGMNHSGEGSCDLHSLGLSSALSSSVVCTEHGIVSVSKGHDQLFSQICESYFRIDTNRYRSQMDLGQTSSRC